MDSLASPPAVISVLLDYSNMFEIIELLLAQQRRGVCNCGSQSQLEADFSCLRSVDCWFLGFVKRIDLMLCRFGGDC